MGISKIKVSILEIRTSKMILCVASLRKCRAPAQAPKLHASRIGTMGSCGLRDNSTGLIGVSGWGPRFRLRDSGDGI